MGRSGSVRLGLSCNLESRKLPSPLFSSGFFQPPVSSVDCPISPTARSPKMSGDAVAPPAAPPPQRQHHRWRRGFPSPPSSAPKPPLKPPNCNLDRFLEATCLSVRAQHLPKSCQRESCRKRQQNGNVENLPYFILGDLWDSFDEWSAYGVGVPINLKGQDPVMQYYVPYLSAIQLYTRTMKRQNIKRRSPDPDNDCCSSTISFAADDGVDDMAVPDCHRCQCGTLESCSLDSESCCGCDAFKKISELELRNILNEESSSGRDWHGHLLYEYFESSPPYARVPLSEKISQISADFSELKTLRSVDLLPASWMAIAWYPIYRIPTGPTLRDLEACFLTFHSLSTSLQDGEPLGIVKPSNRPMQCATSVVCGLQWDHPMIKLEAFGLAHYKLRGSIWTSVGNLERKHAASMYRCAEAWLKQLQVGHPDFEFFQSHNPPPQTS